MTRHLLIPAILLVLTATAEAKPILRDSQSSHAAVCIDRSEPAQRLVAICETALADPGASVRDHRRMKVSLASAYDTLGKFDQARTLVDEVLAEDPAHTGALNVLGWIHWGTSDYTAARAAFRSSIDAGATAQAFAGLASSGRLDGTMDEAEYLTLIDTAIALRPEYIWARRDKGWFYVDSDRAAEAEPIFAAALEYEPEEGYTLYGYGSALLDQGKVDAALEQLNRAIDTGDVPINAYAARARANFQAANYRRTIVDADTVIERSPTSGSGHVWKARAQDALGQTPAAVTGLRAFLATGHNAYAAYWLADILYHHDRSEEAVTVLQALFDEGEADYFDHEFMALLRIETDALDVAQAHIDSALSLRPEAAYPRYYTALIQARAGAFDDAENSMLAALSRGLPGSQIRFFIGELTEKGEFVRGIQFRIKANALLEADQ